MILLTFQSKDGLRLGAKTERGIIDLQAAGAALGIADAPQSPDDCAARGLAALPILKQILDAAGTTSGEDPEWLLDEGTIQYGACIPNPGKILCVGLNYRRHATETGNPIPETPVLFSKFNNTVAAANEAIPLPSNAERYDYEAELVVVVGKTAKNVSEEDALDYVLGYCNANDISARDLQMRTGQWLMGKTVDKFFPTGPYLVTADDIPDPQDLDVKCWMNGELRQDSNTSDMIFSVAQVISYASQYMTLSPGDVISTGTPEGVILGMEEKIWMKPGDEVIVEVGNLGQLKNKMVADG